MLHFWECPLLSSTIEEGTPIAHGVARYHTVHTPCMQGWKRELQVYQDNVANTWQIGQCGTQPQCRPVWLLTLLLGCNLTNVGNLLVVDSCSSSGATCRFLVGWTEGAGARV
jgi:hypothetical protein